MGLLFFRVAAMAMLLPASLAFGGPAAPCDSSIATEEMDRRTSVYFIFQKTGTETEVVELPLPLEPFLELPAPFSERLSKAKKVTVFNPSHSLIYFLPFTAESLKNVRKPALALEGKGVLRIGAGCTKLRFENRKAFTLGHALTLEALLKEFPRQAGPNRTPGLELPEYEDEKKINANRRAKKLRPDEIGSSRKPETAKKSGSGD